jgi:hypothetical protein
MLCLWVGIPCNVSKHQTIILLICINLTKENIVEYCGTWYGTNHGHFKAMLVGLTSYLWFDEDYYKDLGKDDNVIDISSLTTMSDNVPNAYDGV